MCGGTFGQSEVYIIVYLSVGVPGQHCTVTNVHLCENLIESLMAVVERRFARSLRENRAHRDQSFAPEPVYGQSAPSAHCRKEYINKLAG